VSAIGFNASTSRVITSHDDGRLIVCEMTPSGLVARECGAGAPALTFGQDNWAHASFGESPAFAWATSRDGGAAFAGHAEKIYSNLHGRLISSTDVRGLVSQVDLESGKVTARLEVDPASPVIDMDVTPDRRFLVTLMENGAVKLWDWRKKDRQVALGQHNESDPVVAITPDGRRVLSAADDGFLVVWELTTGHVRRLRGYRDHAFGIRISPDSDYALVISAGYCNVWDLKSLTLGSTLGAIPGSGEEYTVWIRDAVVLPSNDRAITVTGDGVVTTWDMKTGKPIGEPYSTGHAAQNAVFSKSGRWLLIAPSPDRLVLYDLSQHVSMREYALPAGAQLSSLFPAGEVAAFRIEVSRGDSLCWVPEHDAPVPHRDDALGLTVRTVTPDGRYALGSDGATVTLIDLGANAALATYTADSQFSSFALSPDGQIAALGDADKGVHVLVLVAAR
jgi:WD40 repeat protein